MSVVETYNVHNDNLAITEFRNYLGNEIEKEVTAVMGGEIMNYMPSASYARPQSL